MKHLIFCALLVCIAIIACRKDNRDRQIRHKIKTVTHHSGIVDTEQHMGYRFPGVQSPKAPERIVIEDYDLINGGAHNCFLDNTYETDGKGRITKRITTTNTGVSTTMYTYY